MTRMHILVSVGGCTQVRLRFGSFLQGGRKATLWPPFHEDKLETDIYSILGSLAV